MDHPAQGEPPWRRLASLEYGIVGAGRSGSILACAIAEGWGAENLTLIDPDTLARHNLGESDLPEVTPAELGRAKVDVLAERLRQSRETGAGHTITPVAESIVQLRALGLANQRRLVLVRRS